jgi:hypothetical protein
MIKLRLICGAGLALAFVFSFAMEASAQTPDDVLLREIAPCQVLVGGHTSPPDVEHEQPCQAPGINELVMKRFGDNTYGVLLNYTDYSRAWVRLLECSFTGIGVKKQSALLVSPIDENGKSGEGQACQISIKSEPLINSRSAVYTIDMGAGCKTVCSHPDSLNSISITSIKEKPFSPAFNCRKATTPTEQSICLNWDLSELDLKVAELWYVGYGASGEVPPEAKSVQNKWLTARNQCRFNTPCIRDKYRQRVKELCTQLNRKIDKNGSCQA